MADSFVGPPEEGGRPPIPFSDRFADTSGGVQQALEQLKALTDQQLVPSLNVERRFTEKGKAKILEISNKVDELLFNPNFGIDEKAKAIEDLSQELALVKKFPFPVPPPPPTAEQRAAIETFNDGRGNIHTIGKDRLFQKEDPNFITDKELAELYSEQRDQIIRRNTAAGIEEVPSHEQILASVNSMLQGAADIRAAMGQGSQTDMEQGSRPEAQPVAPTRPEGVQPEIAEQQGPPTPDEAGEAARQIISQAGDEDLAAPTPELIQAAEFRKQQINEIFADPESVSQLPEAVKRAMLSEVERIVQILS